jgi:cell wall-associated NlpC family hydrolase
MRAWQSAGRDIPRLAASQYFATRHISQGELRPGDLLFWGSTPSSIYHVALYIGDGKMIQAPRPGRSVEVQSIYYWISPSYFGRV